ncbi:dihydropteroate synthase [Halopseudomonas salegens]|uniref:Dihydropteroate synthase n=1 Tax=Halopseudomonas salegens TaxID=1434072 RepID=A0A1H2I235_9GAMM|nr:dihydropteroate synthase [Halopseudomonas salegens]SDU38193.1 Dihydropteroate synthase [Halopseudomonas salegens]
MADAVRARWLPCGSQRLDLSTTQVMGVLNVTPDSFSDGGHFSKLDAALYRCEQMLDEGATLIDVGGESTRPGAEPVSATEELDRVVPVVAALRERFDVVVSMDTSTPEVMRAGAAAGAGVINDVRALRRSGALAAAAETGLAVCLMHMQGEPGSMQAAPHYEDLLAEVSAFLGERVAAARAAGVSEEALVIDPGFGFGKTLEHNLQLFARMSEVAPLQRPLLVGVSRKSMIGNALQRPLEQRLAGGLALASLAVTLGARIIRTHDVAATLDAVRMTEAVLASRG